MHESRGSALTPAEVAEWEARVYVPLARHRDVAAATVVDDELPEDPQDHLEETRAALEHIPTA